MPRRSELSNQLVREFLTQIAGEEALTVADLLDCPMTDEALAAKCKAKVTMVRAVLNKLNNYGIAEYGRDVDKDSGWYSYTWQIHLDKVLKIMRDRRGEELKQLDEKISYERAYVFYQCSNGCEKMPFEIAAEYNFRCPGCRKPMGRLENEERIGEIEGLKQKLKSELALL